MKLSPEKFVTTYLPEAQKAAKGNDIIASAMIIKAALESGWGGHAPRFNFSGIKYNPALHHSYQRLPTKEVSSKPDAFPKEDVISVTFDSSVNKYRYRVYQKFAAFNSAEEAFSEVMEVLDLPRYKKAKEETHPVDYLIAIWKAGYSTALDYDVAVKGIYKMIKQYLP